jgi:anaerobic selenocysteine-containing dehydrogenase/Fe-S-cluster-containing dehydrogenase component
MERRTFLKLAGLGCLSAAAGCSSRTEKTLYALVETPDDRITGKANWYASTCRECPAGCGILAKNREGRVVKIEGNPLHPINRGGLCMRGQAALQAVYNPDRIKTPLMKRGDGWEPLSYAQAEGILKEQIQKAVNRGSNRVRMMTEVCGEALLQAFEASLSRWKSGPLLVFEPYAYESLKSANERVFGHEGLPSYRMEEADFLLSFGADFLETWLSPVEYARKFKEMHGLKDGNKARFFQVSPYQSLTGSNADQWLSCRPGAEAVIALGLIREALLAGRGRSLPLETQDALRQTAQGYPPETVCNRSGLAPGGYEKLLDHVLQARKPLILGPGSAPAGPGALQAHIATNLLNFTLDPELTLFDFRHSHRVEIAATRAQVLQFFQNLKKDPADLLLLNNVNPVFALPPASKVTDALQHRSFFMVSFSNFMDETTALSDLVLPVQLPLETWDTYESVNGVISTLQPAMASLTGAPGLGDLLVRAASGDRETAADFKSRVCAGLFSEGRIKDEKDWLEAIKGGGFMDATSPLPGARQPNSADAWTAVFDGLSQPSDPGPVFIAAPSIRFFDGRGANRPWLCEVPDPLTRVAWQTPVLVHPETLSPQGLKQGDLVRIDSKWGSLEMPVYVTEGVRPGVLVTAIGQGHRTYGRYAEKAGANPLLLLPPDLEPISGAPLFYAEAVKINRTGKTTQLAHTDGSRSQHGRKIALSAHLKDLQGPETNPSGGMLSMWEFPFTLPLPEGYDRARDIYPPHDHAGYRWAMIVDLDRCIGCGACAVACYAENNLGIVGPERIIEGREMAWLSVERYQDPAHTNGLTFLPMLCQHCDNAPCESVCPVYAPHHSKEGVNNQIYNRCIGTRFCSQNCPYKVRRFNWFDWEWPHPLNLQLNPDVTVRSKGVMEKCSFCIQRIKEAHGRAKDEKREIRDGEVMTACLQTCPTGAIVFGNLMDKESRVRKMTEDRRAYQVMGYLNTKPAVIYLKKVRQEA